ncbi:MAG TPA: hemerythrin family protein [Firmicutes bacterium]|nr:hemerythrin family protein [Candidatus Fermentithermobacillaceae bacterium]
MLTWSESLSTGIEAIDSQHKELFSRINSLLSAMAQGKGKDQVKDILVFLGDYVVTHFGTEEKYMRQYLYPAYPSHKREHAEYIERFNRLKQKLDSEGVNSLLAIESQELLVQWWGTHIGKTDKALGAFLRTKIS